MIGRKVGLKQQGAGTLRFVLYPRHMHSRAAVHSLATATSVFFTVRMNAGLPWWNGIFWYFGSFLGVHIAMVPLMTAWHVALGRFDRWVRAIVEEELIRFDMHTYERQLERVIARSSDPPT